MHDPETIRDALKAARECIQQDRTHLADAHIGPDNTIDADGQLGLDEYDAVLAKIDAAIAVIPSPIKACAGTCGKKLCGV